MGFLAVGGNQSKRETEFNTSLKRSRFCHALYIAIVVIASVHVVNQWVIGHVIMTEVFRHITFLITKKVTKLRMCM